MSAASDSNPIYLDHNATTPVLPEVVEAMRPYLTEHFGNPSSAHVLGRRAREAVAHARAQVARLAGCGEGQVVFTSGGTEANNLAIFGVTRAARERRQVVTTVIEHPATAMPCKQLEQEGWQVDRLGVDANGQVEPAAAAAALDAQTALVTVMHANNETGSVQPIAEIARAAHAHGALLHTDAAQSAGKLPIALDELGADLLSIAGHKMYAPKGVGALLIRDGVELAPLLLGAGHEHGLRPGTENVPGLVGLGQACEIAYQGLATEAERLRALRDQLWAGLADHIEGLTLHGHAKLRLPNTLNVGFPGVRGSALLERAPEVAASTGSACHAGLERPSAVLTAMGIDAAAALGAVRFSLGRSTTPGSVARTVEALVRAHGELV